MEVEVVEAEKREEEEEEVGGFWLSGDVRTLGLMADLIDDNVVLLANRWQIDAMKGFRADNEKQTKILQSKLLELNVSRDRFCGCGTSVFFSR